MSIDPRELVEGGFDEQQAATLARLFERFDRSSAQRFALLQYAINDGFARLEQRMNVGFAGVEERFTSLDQRLDGSFTSLHEDMEQGFRQVGHAFGELEEQLNRIEQAIKNINPNGSQP